MADVDEDVSSLVHCGLMLRSQVLAEGLNILDTNVTK